MIMAVVPEEKVNPCSPACGPFERYSGVVFVSDVTVSRRDYFGKKAPKS